MRGANAQRAPTALNLQCPLKGAVNEGRQEYCKVLKMLTGPSSSDAGFANVLLNGRIENTQM